MDPRIYSWPVAVQAESLVNMSRKDEDVHGHIVRSS